MSPGKLVAVGIGYSVITPAGVISPTAFPVFSVNHRLPSGPAVMPPAAVRRSGPELGDPPPAW